MNAIEVSSGRLGLTPATLLYFLVWRDLKVRYKETVIGAVWAILQLFVTMVVFSLFFGALAHIPSNGLPYPIFYYLQCTAALDVLRVFLPIHRDGDEYFKI